MYCKKCGAVVPDNSNFCQICGEKITLNTSQNIEVDFDTFMSNQGDSQNFDYNPILLNNSSEHAQQDTRTTNINAQEHSTFESNENNNTNNSTTSSTNDESVKGSFFQGLLGIIAIIIIISISNNLIRNYKSSGSIGAAISDTIESLSNLGDRTNANSNRQMEIYNITKDIIRDELTTPSTAVFPAFNMKFIKYDGSVYTISAYVDHDNIMGAKVRSYFTTEIKETNKGYDYKIIKLE